MVRFIIVIISCFFLILYYVPKMSYYAKHEDKYNEEECYRMAKIMVEHVKKRGRISTVAMGMEKLPEEGGYLMIANHQGKYDVLGLISSHDKPCTYVMDAKRSRMFIVNQLCNLVRAKRLDKSDIREQVQIINDVATEIKAGRRYLIFPEGGYDHNHNTLGEFMPGSFKIAQRAKCPIVPVVLYDSFKPFEGKSFRKVVTQLRFLDPIPYDVFAGMKTQDIRDMVVQIIGSQLENMESLNDW